jgi:hypothetical protein
MGINNLLNFWSEKIRENLTNFFIDQKLLVLIDEIDQKITRVESKKESIAKENQKQREKMKKQRNASTKERNYIPHPYKPVIKDKEENKKDIIETKNNKNDNIYPRRNERKKTGDTGNNRYTRKTDNEEKRSKSPDEIDLNKNKENLATKNNLQNNYFNFQEEKLGENILEISKKNQNIISYIDIDLFLQRIAEEKKIYDDMNDNDLLLTGFCIQHPIFIPTNILINKIISCFNYFYSRYLNEDNEKDILNHQNKDENKNVREKNSQTYNSRRTMGYRNRYKQIKEARKPEKEKFGYLINNKNKKKLPFNLIDLLILFIDLHEKYSKEIFTNELIEKIDNFYITILNIYDIKKKYKEDIDYSSQILKGVKNRATLRRIKTQGTKLEYKKIFSNENLLSNIIRDPNKPLSFFNLLDYDSREIANELTRITYYIFSQIQPKEFFKGVFTKKNKNVTSPHIVEISDRFNQLSFWVIEEILSYDYGNDRAEIIEKFIDIANELNNLNNFSDCMSIVISLGQMIVTGLLKTWKYVSKESNLVLQNLKKIVNFADNYKSMRDRIEECIQNNIPYIPFLGPYNKRICFLEEYGPYVNENSLINVDKIVLVQQILDQFYKYRTKKYDILRSPKNEFIIFQFLDPAAEEELEKLSSFIEPNFTLSEKRSHEKRATNTEIHFKENYENKDDII